LNFVHVLARVWSSWLMLLHQGEGWDIFFTHSSCHSNSTAYPFISLWMEVSKSSTYSQAFISTILGISALTSSWLDWLFAALVFDCFIGLGSWAVGVNWKLSDLWLDRWELLLWLVNEIDILFLVQIHFLAGMNRSLWRRYLIKFRIVASIRWSSIISLTFLSSQLWLGWNPRGSVFVVRAAGGGHPLDSCIVGRGLSNELWLYWGSARHFLELLVACLLSSHSILRSVLIRLHFRSFSQ